MKEHTADSTMTWGEWFDSALACNTKEDAAAWLKIEVERHRVKFGNPPKKARTLIASNLGYMAGYYDGGVASKIHRLFGAVHPIFGSAYETGEADETTG